MINIYRKNSETRKLVYINEVPSHNALNDWLAKNLPWTDEQSEIDQQLKKHNKVTSRELRSIAEANGYVFVEFGDTPEYTDAEEEELID